MLNHPAFDAAPTLGQLAKNDAWESAWSFTPETSPTEATVREYLHGATEVAFEAFFGETFFGIRLVGAPDWLHCRVMACIKALETARDGKSFFASLDGFAEFEGLGRDIRFAEIGAVNAWRSVGTFLISDPDSVLGDFDAMWAKLLAAPVARHIGHRKALEFCYDRPVRHWVALPASAALAPFALDKELVRQAFVEAFGRDAQR